MRQEKGRPKTAPKASLLSCFPGIRVFTSPLFHFFFVPFSGFFMPLPLKKDSEEYGKENRYFQSGIER